MADTDTKENPTATQSDIRIALDEWLDGLDTPQATLTKHSMETLAKTMRKNMAVRDSILVSVICSNSPEYDMDKIRDYAFQPMRHDLVEWCERSMKWSFKHAGNETDKGKIAKAIKMLADITETVGDTNLKLQAQPFAIISYMLWWMGDKRAVLAAMHALSIDEECSLAAIVVSAIHNDQWPNRN